MFNRRYFSWKLNSHWKISRGTSLFSPLNQWHSFRVLQLSIQQDKLHAFRKSLSYKKGQIKKPLRWGTKYILPKMLVTLKWSKWYEKSAVSSEDVSEEIVEFSVLLQEANLIAPCYKRYYSRPQHPLVSKWLFCFLPSSWNMEGDSF